MTTPGANSGPGRGAERSAVASPLAYGEPLRRGLVAPGAALAGADLRGFDLSAADLVGADLRGADLSGATLHDCRLRGARLDGACLAGVSAHDIDLEGATLVEADLTDADLLGAILLEADLSRARLARASLRRADLRDCSLSQADLRGVDLRSASLGGADLHGALLDDAQWARTHLRDTTGLTEAQRLALLDQGAWEGIITPELGPFVALGARALRPATHWAQGRVLRLRSQGRGWLADRAEARRRQQLDQAALREGRALLEEQARRSDRAQPEDAAQRPATAPSPGALGGWLSRRRAAREQRAVQRATAREQDRLARLAALPGGPGEDLSERDLSGRQLQGVDWRQARLERIRLEGAHLQGANLSQAVAGGAELSGARLADARLVQIQAHRARLIDADLRRVDLTDADLSAADLTGADLRGARLTGADLTGADLTAARLADLDLRDVKLDGAVLDQADLTGADLSRASVEGTDLRGSLGLSPRQRAALADAGARTTDASLGDLARRIQPRHMVAALSFLVVGLGSYGAARWLLPGSTQGASITAAAVRELPPEQALERFEELAEEAELTQDKVGWLIEAAGQARRLERPLVEERLLRESLALCGEDVELGAEVRLTLANLLKVRGDAEAAMALVDPLLDLSRQPAEQRARSVLLYQQLGEELGVDTAARIDQVMSTLEHLPDAAAELHLALANTVAAEGDAATALERVALAEALEISDGTRARLLETRARIHDRAGDLDAAALAWTAMAAEVEAGTAAQHAAMLALSDVRQRQGDARAALALIEPLLEPGTDPRIRIRAWMIRARMHEDADEHLLAAQAYQSAIALSASDPEMAEEARIALARLVGTTGDSRLATLLEELDPEARAMVEVQAALGEARSLLASGQPEAARRIYKQLLEREELDAVTLRDARTGIGEALASEGQVAEALVVWRDLLSETARTEDRIHLQLRIADGLLMGGRFDEAEEAFGDLAAHSDADVAIQGRLGLAQVALVQGERERARAALQDVADQASDPAWRVRALEELADMATQDGDVEAAIAGWRAVLAAAPAGHAAAGRARLAVVTTLSAAGRVDEARSTCLEAITGATSRAGRKQATLACAELDERLGDLPVALDGYDAAAEDAPEDIVVDASIGGARVALALEQPARALAATEIGLAVAGDARSRLLLLDARVRALELLGRDSAEASAARDELFAAAPQAAVTLLIESAQAARGQADLDRAIALLGQARDASSDSDLVAGVLLELADVQLEAGQLDDAEATYGQAAQARPDDAAMAFQTGMGRAEILRRKGDPAAAASALSELAATDGQTARWLAEARARALAEAGDDASLEAWDALTNLSGDDAEGRATALRGKADALFAVDRYAEALPLYEEAAAIAPDPALAGWAALGVANSRAALGQPGAERALDALMSFEDPEVAVQAAVRRSQLAAEAEDWETASRVLDGVDARDLGSAWDTTVSLAQASALSGAKRYTEAAKVLAALDARWPNDEEAAIPVLLAKAELARARGDLASAQGYARQALEQARDPGFQQQARDLLDQLDEP